ncbi:L-lactate dehydrogenase complex protein LldF [Thermomonospora echinospora]|uniref:L-lactate dehydrogenase complex protein LldF n=1 Tax=Thermomonospora echinospora TaxID=1992 RepID=A0A1H5TLU4_9ACTN|nr:LUD domain-containing protein [Thermomonospora echinospora]SEF63733.1 L-lactate dehydrogenase complex protein LldF [Thermomonospora echinospora]
MTSGPIPLPMPRVLGALGGTGPGEAARPRFATAAREALADTGQRRSLRESMAVLRGRREAATAEAADWEELREAGRAVRDRSLLSLDTHLETLEGAVTDAGGTVHWAADAAEARRIVVGLVRATGRSEVIEVRSPVTREIGLDRALAGAGVDVAETGAADLAVRLAGERPAHFLLPAVHRDPAEIRRTFLRRMPGAPSDLTDDPRELADAARAHLRRRLLSADVAVIGAAFAVAETGTLVMPEGDGGGRMCLTLPETLICVLGIEQVVPCWRDMEILLQLLPRSATGERMSPYVSTWTGVSAQDGPRDLHVVLLDNGRTAALADEVGRAALRCIGCAACLSVCPVYERTGGHAYAAGGSVLSGPIGAIWTPQTRGVRGAAEASLPFASTLCGACGDVCPVKIDIPGILVHLRGKVVQARRHRPVPPPEMAVMRALAWAMGDRRRYEPALRQGVRWARLLSRGGRIRRLPGLLGKWTEARDLPAPPRDPFRVRWRER